MTRRISIALSTIVAATMALPLAAQAQTNSQWEGFYAGLNAGGLWSSTSASIVENNTGGGFNGTGSGFVGGAQAGYNYLFGPVLLALPAAPVRPSSAPPRPCRGLRPSACARATRSAR
jgi:opacity protein-like surface antigen